MRRKKKETRTIKPDFIYGDVLVSKFSNYLMWSGKRMAAQKIIYKALEDLAQKTKKPAIEALSEAVENVSPVLEVRPKRIGGATYQVPREVPKDRAQALALRWLIQASRARKGQPMWQKLSVELLDAYKKQGSAFKKKEDTHRMAEANRAFAHFAR